MDEPKGFCAVKSLTFGAKSSDCFGLLGNFPLIMIVETFVLRCQWRGKDDHLRHPHGEKCGFIRSGTSRRNRRHGRTGTGLLSSVRRSFARPNWGVNWHDPVSNLLMQEETLLFIGRLNGLPDVKGRAQKVLQCIKMDDMGGKLVKHYRLGPSCDFTDQPSVFQWRSEATNLDWCRYDVGREADSARRAHCRRGSSHATSCLGHARCT